MKRLVVAARVAVSVLSILFVVAGAPVVLFLRDKESALIIAGVGIAAFLLVRIDEVAELSLGPLKARMKETIAEANATVEQLRSVALELGRSGLATLMAASFFDGMTQTQRFALYDKVVASLKGIGASDEQVSYATQDWRKGVTVIYHRIIREEIEKAVDPANKNAVHEEFQAFLDYPNWQTASPDRMEEFARQRNGLNAGVQEWIGDYRNFLRVGVINRRDLFEKG